MSAASFLLFGEAMQNTVYLDLEELLGRQAKIHADEGLSAFKRAKRVCRCGIAPPGKGHTIRWISVIGKRKSGRKNKNEEK